MFDWMAVFNNCQMHEPGRDYTAALIIASVPRMTSAGILRLSVMVVSLHRVRRIQQRSESP